MNLPVDWTVSFGGDDREITRQRRIGETSRVEAPRLQDFHRGVKHMSFIDVADVGQSGRDRDETNERREQEQRTPENELVPFFQHFILTESRLLLEYGNHAL